MEAWLKIAVGFVLTLISLGYLYRPGWVAKWNAVGRQLFFNDTFILFYRRRLGLLFFMAATLFFYSGFNNLALMKARETPSTFLDVSTAYRLFQAKKYGGTLALCKDILKREPDNVHAWVLMGSSLTAEGKTREAKQAWRRLLEIDPQHAVGKYYFMAEPAQKEDGSSGKKGK